MNGNRTLANSREQWYICSDLVSIRWHGMRNKADAVSAVLEEIGPDRAVVQLETEVASSTLLRLDCGAARFDGVVRRCWKERDLGYFAEIDFARGQQWSVALYRPRHLLDLGMPEPHTAGHDHKDFAGAKRWEDSIPPAPAPPEEVCVTVRRVARNLAVVGGEMEYAEMARCFSRLFHRAPQGVLFGGFVSAYRRAREGDSNTEDAEGTEEGGVRFGGGSS